VLATLAAIGFAALAWAAFVSPLPRLTYNPSDSVAVGWYRIDPFDPRTASLPRPLSVDSIVLVPLPATAAALAAQRGYLPARAAAQTCGRGRAATRLHRRRSGTHRRRAFGRRAACRPAGPGAAILQLCRRLEPGELFLLSVTNPASFDSRYFGPVSASAVIGVAHPVWLETRP
jgi:type IV secretory pathway protease TraF